MSWLLVVGAALAQEHDASVQPSAVLLGSAVFEYTHGPAVGADFDGDGQGDLAVANYQGTHNQHTIGEVFLLPGSTVALGATVNLSDAPVTFYGLDEHDYLGTDLAAVPAEGGTAAVWIGMDHTGLTEKDAGELLRWDDPLGVSATFRADTAASTVFGQDGGRGKPGDALGNQVASLDFDGDGLEDVAVGAPWRSQGDVSQNGRVWVLAGAVPTPGGESAVDSVAAFYVDGAGSDRLAGWRVHAPGDLDGDGRQDLIVGSLGSDPAYAGQVHFLPGSVEAASITVDQTPGTWRHDLAGDYAGAGVVGVDSDGDGRLETIVSAPQAIRGTGKLFWLPEVPQGVEVLASAAERSLEGEQVETLGASLAAGPVLLAGAPQADRVWVLTGGLEVLGVLEGGGSGWGAYGWSVDWVGDLTGDGVPEAAVAAPDTSVDLEGQGLVQVLDGAPLAAGALSDGGAPDLDGDGVAASVDCDDADPRQAPGLGEVCRTDLDEDCDGVVDETECSLTGCGTSGSSPTAALGWLALVGLLARRARWA